jgi:chitin disaccharide deacetylase
VTAARRVIVNADDFGRSKAINAGVIKGHLEGIVTSASLMVRHPAAAEAVDAARETPALGVGLHLDLCEWEPVGHEWRPIYSVVDTDDGAAVAAEVERQLALFKTLVGAEPTHLDSHQHVHREEPVRSVAVEAARTLGIPLRERGAVRYCGAFYGQERRGRPFHEAITPAALASLIRQLEPGVTEIACHPATTADAFTSYSVERPLELEALCHPAVREAVADADVELCSFRDL